MNNFLANSVFGGHDWLRARDQSFSRWRDTCTESAFISPAKIVV